MKKLLLKVSLTFITIIITIVFLEFLVRQQPIPLKARFERQKVLFQNLPLSEKASFEEDFEKINSDKRWSFNTWGFYGNSPIKTKSINFIPYKSVTARICPDSVDGNSSRI